VAADAARATSAAAGEAAPRRQRPSGAQGAAQSAAQPRRERPSSGRGATAPRRQQSSGAGPNSASPDGASPNSVSPNSVSPNSASPNSARAAGAGRPRKGPTREEIEERAADIDKQNFFEILGVEREDDADAVRGAFYKLAKSWHPDRLPEDVADLKAKVAKLFARFNEAHQTLTDPKKREDYLKVVDSGGGTAEDNEIVERAMDSALQFQKGEVLFKKGQYEQAEEFVAQAVEADPEQPAYLALLAWIQVMRMGQPSDSERDSFYRKQIGMLNKVIKADPKFDRALQYRGELYKRSGDMTRAIRDFKQAATLNPRNIDAAREVRLWEKRQGSDKGMFGGLFKGKGNK
jgi:curved DNA-binding protein CbpA